MAIVGFILAVVLGLLGSKAAENRDLLCALGLHEESVKAAEGAFMYYSMATVLALVSSAGYVIETVLKG